MVTDFIVLCGSDESSCYCQWEVLLKTFTEISSVVSKIADFSKQAYLAEARIRRLSLAGYLEIVVCVKTCFF